MRGAIMTAMPSWEGASEDDHGPWPERGGELTGIWDARHEPRRPSWAGVAVSWSQLEMALRGRWRWASGSSMRGGQSLVRAAGMSIEPERLSVR
jgi:hypothetical protein